MIFQPRGKSDPWLLGGPTEGPERAACGTLCVFRPLRQKKQAQVPSTLHWRSAHSDKMGVVQDLRPCCSSLCAGCRRPSAQSVPSGARDLRSQSNIPNSQPRRNMCASARAGFQERRATALGRAGCSLQMRRRSAWILRCSMACTKRSLQAKHSLRETKNSMPLPSNGFLQRRVIPLCKAKLLPA